MRIRWSKIVYLIPLLSLSNCEHQTKNKDINNTLKIIDNWTDVEILSQKYLAERKFNDSISCFHSDDHLNTYQKDSLIHYWSKHPDELKEVTNHILYKNSN